MSVRPWRDIARRQSRQIMVGNVPVGGDAPVTVQTMTNTATSDVKATIEGLLPLLEPQLLLLTFLLVQLFLLVL